MDGLGNLLCWSCILSLWNQVAALEKCLKLRKSVQVMKDDKNFYSITLQRISEELSLGSWMAASMPLLRMVVTHERMDIDSLWRN